MLSQTRVKTCIAGCCVGIFVSSLFYLLIEQCLQMSCRGPEVGKFRILEDMYLHDEVNISHKLHRIDTIISTSL